MVTRSLLILVVLSVCLGIWLSQGAKIEFGQTNFWSVHGPFFLFFIALFPRLTLLFSSVASGGILWWLGWLFAPRILVALLATVAYAKTNPILVLISWLVALGGESTEKYYVRRRVHVHRGFSRPPVKTVKSKVVR